jgi:hypothetical protein
MGTLMLETGDARRHRVIQLWMQDGDVVKSKSSALALCGIRFATTQLMENTYE